MSTKNLRPWSTGTTEKTWAICVVALCFIVVASILLWPDKDTTVKEVATLSEDLPNSPNLPTSKPDIKPTVQPQSAVAKKPIPAITEKTKHPSVSHHKKSSPTTSKPYFIQVGAFKDKKLAKKLKKQLIQKHWPVIIQQKKQLYAVQLGPYDDRQQATSTMKKLSHKDKISGFIVSHAYP